MIVARLLLFIFAAATATAQHDHHGAHIPKGMRTPTVTFANDGRAWRVWTEDGHVLVSVSANRGRSWRAAAGVTRSSETIDANGESRPKIALGSNGDVYVSWTRTGTKPYTGDIRFSRSLDGGKTFDPPRTINDDRLETGHRFDALAVGKDGAIHLTWIDKRDVEAATAVKKTYEGAALYHSGSRDRGATFSRNRKIKDNVCECCRIAHAFDRDGNLVLLWRDATGHVRDHWTIRLTPNGTPQRATNDGWTINACPHHGPSLDIARDGVTHMVWFTGAGAQGAGTFYSRLDARGRPIGSAVRLTRAVKGHAVVDVQEPQVRIAWKEPHGDNGAKIVIVTSKDGGATFTPARVIAQTTDRSDHPFLVSSPEGVYLSWYATKEGHRLIEL